MVATTILGTHFEFNVIFIQELSQSVVCAIPSSRNRDGEKLVRVPNHYNWLVFANIAPSIYDINYINTRLLPF